MIIQPKCKGFICTNAHPQGCALNVKNQINLVNRQQNSNIKNALIIGASSGYGLAARISAAFGLGANTLGIFLEKQPSEKRTATAGYYNSAAFSKFAAEQGLFYRNINGDAFSAECKQSAIEVLKRDFGKLDLVIYSLAAPVRKLEDGTLVRSVLKPVGEPYSSKSINLSSETIQQVEIEPASDTEIENTIKVMGGEDWENWLTLLKNENLLSENAQTLAFTYIGSTTTQAIYWNGSIGQAKADLDIKAKHMREQGIDAKIAVLPAVVTQASSAIPVMPLYISLLFKVMQDNNYENNIQKILNRLIIENTSKKILTLDKDMRWRLDNEEMLDKIQNKVISLWQQVDSDNLMQISNFKTFKLEFKKLFGFCHDSIDYTKDISQFVDFDYINLA